MTISGARYVGREDVGDGLWVIALIAVSSSLAATLAIDEPFL